MKIRSQVSAEKLRGGFYTPPALVEHTLNRVRSLLAGRAGPVRILEPSAGDGAFVSRLASSMIDVDSLVGIELMPAEAAKARARLGVLPGSIEIGSAIEWALRPQEPFDVVVGNLPFVRFQFVSTEDRSGAIELGDSAGVSVRGVANLWLPMLLAALRHLRPGGVFALVLPAECLTGISAGSAREWLLRSCSSLRCDLFPAGSFPGALQEIVVLSGRFGVDDARGSVTFAHHARGVGSVGFSDDLARIEEHVLPVGPASWTTLLLSPRQRSAFAEFASLPFVQPMRSVARLGVAAVTGANEFFSLTAAEVASHRLIPWARPLLPRLRYATGLSFSSDDHARLASSGSKAFLFDASLAAPSAAFEPWVALGEARGLHERYKCRIRSPWYAVPHIKHGTLLLSKRSHRFPRLVLNRSAAVTTDTIYCGSPSPAISGEALVAGFQNSGTLLSAELEGRNFGGGVLELVPSEVSRLLVPVMAPLGSSFDRLDALARVSPASDLSSATDQLLVEADVGVTEALMADLAAARLVLLGRRLDRAGPPST